MGENGFSNQEPPKLPVIFPVLAVLFSLVGLADSVYLSVTHFNGGVVPCDLVTGCEKVLTSEFSEIFGVPISALGAISYFSAFCFAIFSFNNNQLAWRLFSVLAFGMAGFSLWLVYLQAFVIEAFCQFCLISAASSICLFMLALGSVFHKKFTSR
jgi:uncharacterized membrane protein